MHRHLREFSEAGVDQVIFLQQPGHNRHAHICQSLELFAAKAPPAFRIEVAAREAAREAELRPYLDEALPRKR